MASLNYHTTVDWDSTLINVGTDKDSLAIDAQKITTGSPSTTTNRWIPGALVINKIDKTLYQNTGTTVTPVWTLISGGGAGNPSLPLESVQYNLGGAFAGDANFTTDGSTDFNLTRAPQAGYTASIQIDPLIAGAVPGIGIVWEETVTGESVFSLWGDLNALAPGIDVGYAVQYQDGINDISSLEAITPNGLIFRSESTVLTTSAQIQIDPAGDIDISANDGLTGFGIEIDYAAGINISVFGGLDYRLPLGDGNAGDVLTSDGAGNTSFQPQTGGMVIGGTVSGATNDWILYVDNAGKLIGDNNFVRDNTTQNTRITTAPAADTAETEWSAPGGISPLIRNYALTAGFEVTELIGQAGSGHRWEVQSLNTTTGLGLYQTQETDIWTLTGTQFSSYSQFTDSTQTFTRHHQTGVFADVTETLNIVGYGLNANDTVTGYSIAWSMTNNGNGILGQASDGTGIGEIAILHDSAELSHLQGAGVKYHKVRVTQFEATLGDASLVGNQTFFRVDDTGSIAKVRTAGDFYVEDTSGNQFLSVDTSTKLVKLGDISSTGMTVTVDGTNNIINITDVPVFADDTAATGGGLVTGDLYQTTTGGSTFLKIVP